MSSWVADLSEARFSSRSRSRPAAKRTHITGPRSPRCARPSADGLAVGVGRCGPGPRKRSPPATALAAFGRLLGRLFRLLGLLIALELEARQDSVKPAGEPPRAVA